MAQASRGARAVANKLRDDLRAARELVERIKSSTVPPNVRMIQRDAGLAIDAIDQALDVLANDFEKIIQRREERATEAIDELLARIAELESWRAQQERSTAPDPARRIEPPHSR